MKLPTAGIKALGVAGAAWVAIAVAGAPAAAHVTVEADKPQAGATAVTIGFTAEAESGTAGIASLRTILPPGIAPADVRYVSGPPGWSLTRQPDGFSVTGPALAPGVNAAYAVRVAAIPAGLTRLPLRTLERYTDGTVNRWIDITKSVEREEDNAAPVLALTGEAPAAGVPAIPAAGAPGTEAPAGAPAAAAKEQLTRTFGQFSNTMWMIGGGGVLAVLLLILWVRSRLGV